MLNALGERELNEDASSNNTVPAASLALRRVVVHEATRTHNYTWVRSDRFRIGLSE